MIFSNLSLLQIKAWAENEVVNVVANVVSNVMENAVENVVANVVVNVVVNAVVNAVENAMENVVANVVVNVVANAVENAVANVVVWVEKEENSVAMATVRTVSEAPSRRCLLADNTHSYCLFFSFLIIKFFRINHICKHYLSIPSSECTKDELKTSCCVCND
jgi:hypothetical protein